MPNLGSQLAALLNTDPKKIEMKFAIVNPSKQGSWVALTEVATLRVTGEPAEDPAGALRNLFDKLTATRGYKEDGDIRVAIEMALADESVDDLFNDLFKNDAPAIAKPVTDDAEDGD